MTEPATIFGREKKYTRNDFCTNCGERHVANMVFGLCTRCYARFRRSQLPKPEKKLSTVSPQVHGLCCECGSRPAIYLESKLCGRCYQRIRKGLPLDYKTPRHRREKEFITNFFDHDQWEYQPKVFYLSNGKKYTPDFYDLKRNVYIEVAGSRQAYDQNKDKYDVFYQTYPNIPLEIRKTDGSLLRHSPTGKGLVWGKELPFKSLSRLSKINPYQPLNQTVGENSHFAKLKREDISKIRNDSRTYAKIALDYGISIMTVSRIKNHKIWKSVA